MSMLVGIGEVGQMFANYAAIEEKLAQIIEISSNINAEVVEINAIKSELLGLAGQFDIADLVVDVTETVAAQTLKINHQVDQFQNIARRAIAPLGNDWQPMADTVTGIGQNGATFSAANKTLIVATNFKGIGSHFTDAFNPVTAYPNILPGSPVTIRFVIIEPFVGAMSFQDFRLEVTLNGAPMSVEPVISILAPKVVAYDFLYTAGEENNLVAKFVIGTNSQTATGTSVYSFSSAVVFFDDARIEQLGKVIGGMSEKMLKVFSYYERSAVISTCVANGTVDDATQLQAELDLAVSTSGIWFSRLGESNYRCSVPVKINGALRIHGRGWDKTRCDPRHDKAFWEVATDEAFSIEDLWVIRGTGNTLVSTGLEITNLLVNEGSIIKRVKFYTPTGVKVNYFKGVRIVDCFFGSANAIVIGSATICVAESLYIEHNVFLNGTNSNVILGYCCNSIFIRHNWFKVEGGFYCSFPIRFRLIAGDHKNLIIEGNLIEHFRDTAVSFTKLQANDVVTLSKVDTINNIISDSSPVSTSKVLDYQVPGDSYKIQGNTIHNKQFAISATGITRMLMTDNILLGAIVRDGNNVILNTNRKPVSFVNVLQLMQHSNLVYDQSLPGTGVGCTTVDQLTIAFT